MQESNINSSNPTVRKFSDYLRSKGMRTTPERMALLSQVLAIAPRFTVEQLAQQMSDAGFRVSRATVYNTLQLLIDANIVRRQTFDGFSTQYERVTQPHTHLICTQCGKIKEVRDNNFAAFMNARRFNAFNIDHYSLHVYGICSTCARKRKRTSARQASSGKSKKEISK